MNLLKILLLTLCFQYFIIPSYAENISVDEEKLVSNIRKSLSVPVNWKMQIMDLKPSVFTNLYQARIEIMSEKDQRNVNIFVSSDSRYYIVGHSYDVNVDMDVLRQGMIDMKNAPYKGNPKAPVTIVEFSDLQCGSCKNAHRAIEQEKLVESYGDKVRLVYKNYPLARYHNWALPAAVACMCAYEQKPDAFWKMQEEFFVNQSQITPDNLSEKAMSFAKSTGLNLKSFKECYEKQKTLDRVNADLADGAAIGIESTPTFFVNGRIVTGFPGIANFKLLIDHFLNQK